jgi:hypothetical protein
MNTVHPRDSVVAYSITLCTSSRSELRLGGLLSICTSTSDQHLPISNLTSLSLNLAYAAGSEQGIRGENIFIQRSGMMFNDSISGGWRESGGCGHAHGL